MEEGDTHIERVWFASDGFATISLALAQCPSPIRTRTYPRPHMLNSVLLPSRLEYSAKLKGALEVHVRSWRALHMIVTALRWCLLSVPCSRPEMRFFEPRHWSSLMSFASASVRIG